MDRVERAIREAQERGEFDNLPGAGRPLDLSDAGDPDWWVKRFMQREGLSMADALPPLFILREQARSYPQSLAGIADEDAVRQELLTFNRMVRDEILRSVTGTRSPVIVHTVDVEDLVVQWRALRQTRESRTLPEPAPPRPARTWGQRLRRGLRGSS